MDLNESSSPANLDWADFFAPGGDQSKSKNDSLLVTKDAFQWDPTYFDTQQEQHQRQLQLQVTIQYSNEAAPNRSSMYIMTPLGMTVGMIKTAVAKAYRSQVTELQYYDPALARYWTAEDDKMQLRERPLMPRGDAISVISSRRRTKELLRGTQLAKLDDLQEEKDAKKKRV